MNIALRAQASDAPPDGIDPARFRKVLSSVPTAVSIVSGADGLGPFGIVVGSFVSISLAPPLVGLFLDNRSSTLPRLLKCQEICVNVLSADQAQLCREFSREKESRFRRGRWLGLPGSPPRLDGSLAWICGSISRSVVIGDHHLIVLQPRTVVDNAERTDSQPLIFFRGGFAEKIANASPNGQD